jgi:hypothetical protein
MRVERRLQAIFVTRHYAQSCKQKDPGTVAASGSGGLVHSARYGQVILPSRVDAVAPPIATAQLVMLEEIDELLAAML